MAQSGPSVGSHVVVAGGKHMGTVTALMTDQDEHVVGLVVQYGLLHKRVKHVPMDHVKWVNQQSVVLDLSPKQFQSLPDWSAPASTVQAEPASNI